MAKKEILRKQAPSLSPISREPAKEINRNVYYQGLEDSLNYFNPENAPSSYQELKKEVLFLEKIHAQSFIVLAHRLKIIRDKELYKEDRYNDFKSFIENELDLAKRMVYNYIKVMDVFGEDLSAPGALVNHKITSLVKIAPFAKNYPEDKRELLQKATDLSRDKLQSWLKDHYHSEKETIKLEILPLEEDPDWYKSREELIANSKFLREGMKSKTLDNMLKEILNLRILEEPTNKKLLKIKKIVQED